MKTTTQYHWHIILLLCLLFITGCQKAPFDRDIEGMWKLRQFTTLEDGIVHKDCPRIFYSIQLWLVELAERQCTHEYPTCIGHLEYSNDRNQIIMKDFRYRNSTGDNGKAVPADVLLPYGMNSLETTFDIIKADGSTLILESDYARLEFTRF